MRAATAPELALLESNDRRTHLRVLAEDSEGAFTDLSTLVAKDWVLSAEWGPTIDQPIADAVILLWRAEGADSLAPFMEGSPLNEDSLGAYAPRIDSGRQLQIITAVTPRDTAPVAGDMKLMFHGRTEIPSWGGRASKITLTALDLGGRLEAQKTEVDRDYGAPDPGTPLQTVLQQILDDNFGVGVITLRVVGAPAWGVGQFTLEADRPILASMREVARWRGWDVRYLWDGGAGAFALTLSEPDRAKSVPDHTFAPDQVLEVEDLKIDPTTVRNRLLVSYPNSATGERELLLFDDVDSILRFGKQTHRFVFGDDSPINTTPEANTFGTTALSDLADPFAEQKVSVRYWWPVELGDLHRYQANGRHYDVDEDLAVVAYRHRITSEGQVRTTFTTRGKPAGAYTSWLSDRIARQAIEHAGYLKWGPRSHGTDPLILAREPNALLVSANIREVILQLPTTMADADAEVRVAPATNLPRATTDISVTLPARGFIKVLRDEPLDFDGKFVEENVKTVEITADGVVGGASLITDSRISEDGATGHGYVRVPTEVGASLDSISVVERHGGVAGPAQTPDRSQGDASLVYPGRNLIAGEFEHDIPLHQSRESYEDWTAQFGGTAAAQTATITFPRNTAPSLITAEFGGTNGRNPQIEGDADTLSVRVFKVGDTAAYDVERDGGSFQTLPEAPDPGTGNVHIYRFQVRSDSIADVDGSTLIDSIDVPLSGGGAVGAQWERDGSGVVTGVTVTAPAVGSSQLTIFLDSTAVAVDVRLYAWWIFEGSKTPSTIEITGSLNKAINETAIEAGDTYIWNSPFTRLASGSTVRVFIIAEIENATPIVIDTHEVETIFNGSLA